MFRSNSYVFEAALSWTTKHAGETDSPSLNRHSETLFEGSTVPPIRRDLKLCGCCHGAAKFE